MPYFAYGSNLNSTDLKAWCARQKLAYPLGECLGRAWLPDYELVFDTYSGTRRGGVLNVVPRKGFAVPGVLFKVRRNGWRVLNIKEGAPHFYEHNATTVLLTGESTTLPTACHTYLLPPSETFIPPTQRYLHTVHEGSLAHSVPLQSLLAAAQNKEYPLPVFVYGTLKRGGKLHDRMKGYAFMGEASVQGRLLDLGWYPGLVEGSEGDIVHGELFSPKPDVDAEELTARLDTIEGFHGYDKGSLYERRVLLAKDATGQPLEQALPCWGYWWTEGE